MYDIGFSAAKTLKKNLDAKIVNYTNTENAPATKKSCFEKFATPTSNELNSFFNNLVNMEQNLPYLLLYLVIAMNIHHNC